MLRYAKKINISIFQLNKILKVFLGTFILFCSSNFIFISSARANSLVISEIMYDASGNDTGKEWVEIKNIGDSTVNIIPGSGAGSFRFYDGSNHYFNSPTIGSLSINPGEFLVVAQATSTFLASYPNFSGNLTKSSISLNNTSATLKIIDGSGNVLDEIIYQNSWGGNGDGNSLSKIVLSGANDSSNWQGSSPTPGQENAFASPLPTPSPSPAPSPSISPSTPPSPSPSSSVSASSIPSPTPSLSATHSPSPSSTPASSARPSPSPFFTPSPTHSNFPSASSSPIPQITPAPSSIYPHYDYNYFLPSYSSLPISNPLSSQNIASSPTITNTNDNGSFFGIHNFKLGSSSSSNLSSLQSKFSEKLKNLFSSNKFFQKISSLSPKTMFWGIVVAGASATAAFFLFLKI